MDIRAARNAQGATSAPKSVGRAERPEPSVAAAPTLHPRADLVQRLLGVFLLARVELLLQGLDQLLGLVGLLGLTTLALHLEHARDVLGVERGLHLAQLGLVQVGDLAVAEQDAAATAAGAALAAALAHALLDLL